jgi:cytochrome c-type biogenesis protein CcmH
LTRVATALLALCTLGAAVAPAVRAAPVNEDTVREIAAQLRCVVCQSLSVADSPSETATQMRGVIREHLAAGETPEQVKAYFVDKYGLWILLEPPRHGFSLLVWVVPYVGLLGGLVLVGLVVWRWTRRPRTAPVGAHPVDEATRERIRRELAEMDRE